MSHVDEMVQHGVRYILDKYRYQCPYGHDEEFLTSRLELLVLLRQLQIHIDDRRQLLDNITWFHSANTLMIRTSDKESFKLERYEGTLMYKGEKYAFTPFQRDDTTPDQDEA